jgi:hypothetical protein
MHGQIVSKPRLVWLTNCMSLNRASDKAKPAYSGVATVYGYLSETITDKALPARTGKQRGRGQTNPPSLVSRQTFEP